MILSAVLKGKWSGWLVGPLCILGGREEVGNEIPESFPGDACF